MPAPELPAQQAAEQLDKLYRRGFEEGRAAAKGEYEVQVLPLAERLEEIVSSFSRLQDSIRGEKEKQLLEISLAVAKRIVHRELAVDPEAVGALVKSALDRIGAREVRRIRLHPVHREFVQSVLEKAAAGKHIEIVADNALQPGSLLFETENGDLDASVDSQLEEIRRGLTDRL